jgi:hypothetical protein
MKENIREGGVRPSGTLVAVSTEPCTKPECMRPRPAIPDFHSPLSPASFSDALSLISTAFSSAVSVLSYSEFSYRQALSDIALSSYMAFSQSSHLQITVQYRSQDVQRSVLTFCLPMPLQAFSFYLPHLRLFPHLPHFQRHFRCNQFRCIGIVPQGLASVWHPSPVNTLAL